MTTFVFKQLMERTALASYVVRVVDAAGEFVSRHTAVGPCVPRVGDRLTSPDQKRVGAVSDVVHYLNPTDEANGLMALAVATVHFDADFHSVET